MSKLPSIYVGIPTGDNKEYAVLYMLASLRNLDYPPKKLSVNWAVTHLGNQQSEEYLKRLRTLCEAANFPCEVKVHATYPVMADMMRWGPYFAVIMNLHLLRLDFLQSDCEYFWLLGGDNPPFRSTLRRLLKVKADVASAMLYQRYARKKFWKEDMKKRYPVYWGRAWELEHLDELDLEPVLRDELRTAWLEFMFLDVPDLPEGQVIRNSVFGSGCSLIKREVLEYTGYVLGSGGTQSEDLHFCQLAKLRGFDLAIDTSAVCIHFDPDGKVY